MAIVAGRYGGYSVRPPRPDSASRMVDPIPEGWKNTCARAERTLAEPFRGVTTDGQVVPGLFALQQTGISTRADRGPYAGLREFDAEQRNGLELIRALSRAQQEQAILFTSIISTDLPPERYTPPDGCQQSVSFKDNVVIPYEGIRADALPPGQRSLLLSLLQTYTSHLRPGHDQVWMEEIKQHLAET